MALSKDYINEMLTYPFMFCVFMLFVSCSVVDDEAMEQAGQTENTEQEDNESDNNSNMESGKIVLNINGKTFTATLVNNSSTEALVKRLSQGEISTRMNDYGDMEKVGSLVFSLPRNDAYTTTGPGDIILYQGNSFVIYYDSNSWSFTKLGKVDGVSTREQMLELLGGKGEKTVVISLE